MKYWVKFENMTPSATEAPTVSAPASRRIRVLAAIVGGLGTSSASQQLVLSRSATGTTPSNTVTPTPVHADGAASAFTANRTWATAPAGAANGVVLPFNALGGGFRWVATANDPPIEARNAEVVVARIGGAPTMQACSLSLLVEED
jgi:hypothetical protein